MSTKTLFYIFKRVLLAIVTIWIVITITFFVMHAVPGGPFLGEKAISAEAQAALEAKYGLDKPLFEQYTTYLKDIVTRFDFGPSLKQRGRMVIDIIMDGMKTSAKLGIIAAVGAAIIGIVLGAIAALREKLGTYGVKLCAIWIVTDVEVCKARMMKRRSDRDTWKMEHWDEYVKRLDFSVPEALRLEGQADSLLLYYNSNDELADASFARILPILNQN